MHAEMELVRANHKLFNVPERPAFHPVEIKESEWLLRRKLVNEESGEVLSAFMEQNIVDLADGLADTMYVVVGSLVQFGLTPEVRDFASAAVELLEDARVKFNKAVLLKDGDNIKATSCMFEIVCKGICLSLNIQFSKLFEIVHLNNMAKVGPDGKPIFNQDGKYMKPPGFVGPQEQIAALLREAGHRVPEKQDPVILSSSSSVNV